MLQTAESSDPDRRRYRFTQSSAPGIPDQTNCLIEPRV